MKALRYRIELESRVLAAGRGGDPNTVVTRPYLPGSLLRGAFVEAFPNGTDDVSLAADSDTRPFFFDGTVRYLNGYLVDEGGKCASNRRMLPTPRSWHQQKDIQREIKDFAAEEPDQVAWALPYQTLNEPFCTIPQPGETEGIWLDRPGETLKTHHQRPDDAQRRDERTGEIYRYVSLSAGQTFEALVLCDKSAHADQMIEWMGDGWNDDGCTWGLGKSRTTQGRGRICLERVWENGQDDHWEEAPEIESPSRLEGRSTLVVTLLSDLLARGVDGQFVARPRAITGALNRTLEAMSVDARFSPPKRVYMQPALAGGFNRTWGLHLPEADAAAMGSVLVYENPGLSSETLRALEWRGVGARRAEGFGRIAFNLHGDSPELRMETNDDRLKEGRGMPDPRELPDGTPSHAIASQMAERMLRRQLDLALDKAATRRFLGEKRGASTQIGGLRALLRRALMLPQKKEQALEEGEEFDERRSLERGRDLVRNYIEDVQNRTSAQSRFEGLLVHGPDDSMPLPVLDWVRQRVEDGADADEDASIWEVLLGGEEARPAVGTVEAELTDRLAYTYNLRFAHDVLARAGSDEDTRSGSRRQPESSQGPLWSSSGP